MSAPARTVGVAAAVLALGACDLPGAGACHGFALAVDLDREGEQTPVAAAEAFAASGDVDHALPRTGWVEDGTDATGSTLRSGTATLHVVRATDGTWLVDAGERC